MTIRNVDAYVDALWDWGILDGCFGRTRLSVGDVDGIIERNGRFLMLEAKGPGKSIAKGQRIMLERLRRTGLFTILIVWGEPGIPQKLALLTAKATLVEDPADLNRLRAIVASWYRFAEKWPIVDRDGRPATERVREAVPHG